MSNTSIQPFTMGVDWPGCWCWKYLLWLIFAHTAFTLYGRSEHRPWRPKQIIIKSLAKSISSVVNFCIFKGKYANHFCDYFSSQIILFLFSASCSIYLCVVWVYGLWIWILYCNKENFIWTRWKLYVMLCLSVVTPF